MNRFLLKIGSIVIGFSCLWSCADDRLFVEVESKETGITFKNQLTETDDFNIIDYLYFFNGGGVSIGDINNDGLPDIFFSGNQIKNKLYLNKGNLKFEDITTTAGVEGNSTWNTGSIMGDINGDGHLDIYVCAVVGIKGMTGHNELYINNGDGTFTEQSRAYGLDFDSFSSIAALLDYDLDGDLDMYLLNHAIHNQESFGNADLRNKRSYETGDKLLRNDGGQFTDVSEEAGIYGGINGYGLGITISDFNTDGLPDIFVGNDFHEDDYLYINNGDGTFSENLRQQMTHTSRFSMGCDAADINHDGYPDLISLDMLPADETVLKRSDGDERLEILELRTSKYGYYYQFSRNMLQLNNGNGTFSETALMNGVAATDWSWSALLEDFDYDGNQDLFISNGIPRRPNDLDYIRFVSSEQVKQTINSTKLVDQEALQLMPTGEVPNMIFAGLGNGSFADQTGRWLAKTPTFSTASAIGDLDMDGDLDLVVSNINDEPTIYINQNNGSSNFLRIKLNYKDANPWGVGSKVYSWHNGVLQFKELFPVRGFQASSEPLLSFGFGNSELVDSIKVIWPNGTSQTIKNGITLNQTMSISYDEAQLGKSENKKLDNGYLFESIDIDSLNLNFTHKEDAYSDFRRLLLLPYKQSDKGPATTIGDINGDGLDDVFFGGSKRIPSQVFIQQDGKFLKKEIPALKLDSVNEEVAAAIFDVNKDGSNDILVANGGADFYNKSEPLLNKVYLNDSSAFRPVLIPGNYENSHCIKLQDFNKDGWMDVFIGSESTPNDFGNIPQSLLLKNNQGQFEVFQEELMAELGMVTDAIWFDYNNDGNMDLIVIGTWMAPKFLKNNGEKLVEDMQMTSNLTGLWQSISEYDMDGDGDQDLVLGNWGLNSKFTASQEKPLLMYYGDLDKNGATETILAANKDGKYYPLAGLDLLGKQLISLRKKFTAYKDFAGKPIEEVLDQNMLKEAKKFEVTTLSSGYLRNDNGRFEFVPFEANLQLAPILEQITYDFDGDGSEDLLLAGNYFGVQPYHGRFGSFSGALITANGFTLSGKELGLKIFNKSVRGLNIIELNGEPYLLVTIHNDNVQLYKFRK